MPPKKPPVSIDPLSQMLGEISAKLDMVHKTQAEDRLASAAYRTDVRESLGNFKETLSDLRNRTNNNADELAKLDVRVEVLDKRIDGHDGVLSQATGAGKLTKVLWGVFSAIGLGGVLAFLQTFHRGSTGGGP